MPNASWFPQTEAVDTDPFVMNFGTRSGDWNVSPMDPRRHRESERVEAAGYVQGLLQRDFGSYGCRANIHGGPPTDGMAHDETEDMTTFRWTTTVSQLPEEARAEFKRKLELLEAAGLAEAAASDAIRSKKAKSAENRADTDDSFSV